MMAAGHDDDGRSEHEAVGELLGAYALDALDPDEVGRVERHLASCPRCRAEVDQHRETAAALGNGVDRLPHDLWDRIAEEVARTPHPAAHAPAPLQLGPRPDVRLHPPSGERAHGGNGTPRTSGKNARQWRRWAVGAAAAAAVAAIASLSVGLAHTDDQLGQADQALAGRANAAAVQAALSTPGRQLVSLRSSSGSPVAEAVVVPSGRGYLVPASMARLPSGQTYQLWAMFGTKAISLGLLGSHPTDAAFTLRSGSPTQLAVTVEPAGGVVTPDRLPVATGAIPT